MVDFTKFNNISAFEYNDTIISNVSAINQKLIENNDKALGMYWINGVVLVMFIFLLWKLNNAESTDKYDITRSLFIASALSLILTIFILISGWSSTIYPLYLYGLLTIVTSIMLYNHKGKNL